jgi:hypothetical protein
VLLLFAVEKRREGNPKGWHTVDSHIEGVYSPIEGVDSHTEKEILKGCLQWIHTSRGWIHISRGWIHTPRRWIHTQRGCIHTQRRRP